MITLGAVVRPYGAAFGARMTAGQQQVLRAIAQCRTAALGGQVYTCPACASTQYRSHSCRNRHCPTCQQNAARTWLAQQQALLLPVPYVLVTFTLPAQLRAIARQQPTRIYNLLFRASAAALQQLALDPRFLGGLIGMLGVLQTWTRDLRYHPHIHSLVPALSLVAGTTWRVGRGTFLVHAKPLAQLFRAKFRAALRRTSSYGAVPTATWLTPWIINCRPVGSGAAALKYLAPYIFRIALSNNRIEYVANGQITFRYTDAATRQTQHLTLPVATFIHRFLAHVLPKGFVKVRSYGLLRVGNRHLLAQARAVLNPQPTTASVMTATATLTMPPTPTLGIPARPAGCVCPSCGQPMHRIRTIAPPPPARPVPMTPCIHASRGPPRCP